MVYGGLLLAVPSQLIVRQLGSPGTPSNLWAVALLLWWVCATLGGLNTIGPSPVRVGVGVLTLSILASYAAGSASGWWAPLTARERTSDVFSLVTPTVDAIAGAMNEAAFRGLISFAGWMGIVLLAADGLRTWRQLDVLVAWLAWLAALVAGIGVFQFFTGFNLAGLIKIPGLVANSQVGGTVERSVLNRVSSTAVHPIEFGVVMAALFPLALHYAIHTRTTRWAWLPAILTGASIPMSVSRSAIVVAATAFILLMVGWPSRRRVQAVVILPLATVAMRVLIPGLVGTIRSLFTNFFNDPSVSGRTGDYGVVFSLYADHPWFGRGLFTFIPRYYRILDNQYLNNLVELGAVGLCAVLLFFLIGYFSARGARRRTVDEEHRHLALAISASIAGIAVGYVTFDAWAFPMAAGVTFLLIGMAGAAWNISVAEAGAVTAREPERLRAEAHDGAR